MRIMEYIRNNERLAHMDLLTVYATIYELIKDGYVMRSVD